MVSGEPGIGKSRLLVEAGRRAAASGASVFEGQAAELERDFPFGVFVDALDPYLASLDRSALRALSEEQRRLLALVFPALVQGERKGAIVAQERFRCYRAVGELLGALAARGPLVLILDDLQWADAASLELLDHLLRRTPDAPVLLLLAHRAGFSSGALSRVGDRLELGPLGREDADALLGDELQPEARARVYEESGGNPFYLEHLARAERRRGPGPGRESRSRSSNSTCRRPCGRRWYANWPNSPNPTRRVLQGAAVAGDPFTPELAGEIAEEDPAPRARRAGSDDRAWVDRAHRDAGSVSISPSDRPAGGVRHGRRGVAGRRACPGGRAAEPPRRRAPRSRPPRRALRGTRR